MFLGFYAASAQVGIGTTNPEADLHVTGPTSTIRIEGLSAANDPLNANPPNTDPNAADPKVRAFVEFDGDLTLQNSADNSNTLYFLIDNSDELTTPTEFNFTSLNDTQEIYSQTITVESDSYVEIKYNLSYRVYAEYLAGGTSTAIMDEKSYVIKTYFTVDADPGQYGQIAQTYFNAHENGARGYFFNNGNGYVFLPQGEHTIHFHTKVTGPAPVDLLIGGNQDSLKIRLYQ